MVCGGRGGADLIIRTARGCIAIHFLTVCSLINYMYIANYIQIKVTFISSIFHEAFVPLESLLWCKINSTPAMQPRILHVDDVTVLSTPTILQEQQELFLDSVHLHVFSCSACSECSEQWNKHTPHLIFWCWLLQVFSRCASIYAFEMNI